MGKPSRKRKTFESHCAKILVTHGYKAQVVPAINHEWAEGWRLVVKVETDGVDPEMVRAKCHSLLDSEFRANNAFVKLRIV